MRNKINEIKNLLTRIAFKNSISNAQQKFNYSNEVKKDLEKLFTRKDVHTILEEISGFDLAKIFKPRPLPKLSSPKYLFLTDEDLNMYKEKVIAKGKTKIKMIPVMNAREDSKSQILSKDPEMQGFDKSKYIFTDISKGFTDRNRLIVVRETNGLLRRANRQERYFMNQTYFPLEGRFLELPKIFQGNNIDSVLENGEYLYCLERACLQFEPDDPEFIKITHKIYDCINKHRKYDTLRSTRFFGPFVFYLTIEKSIDNLLIDMLEKNLIEHAIKLVNLYYLLNDIELPEEKDTPEMIRSFIINYSTERAHLERLFTVCFENEKLISTKA